MLSVAIYVSNHGYGHAARVSALAETLISCGVFCHIVYQRKPFLFGNLDKNFSKMHARAIDTGVKHKENLITDLEATKTGLLTLLSQRRNIVEREVEFIRSANVDFIVTDAAFLASEIGIYAKVPVVCVTNFEWHYIYSRLFADDAELNPVLNLIWALYQQMDACIRLPFSTVESMSAFRKRIPENSVASECYVTEIASVGSFQNITPSGLLARMKKHYTNLRKTYGLAQSTKLLLVMFGGEGVMELDYKALCKGFDGYVISANIAIKATNHIAVNVEDDFLDIMHNADYVLCKPGYSTLAEAVQMGKYIIYCPRDNYPEEIALIEGLKNYPNCRELKDLNLSSQGWKRLFGNIQFTKFKIENSNCEVAGKIIESFLAIRKKRLISVFDLGTNNLNYLLFDLESRSIIHKAHATTGLGKNFDGKELSSYRIANAKAAMQDLLEIDRHITSQKVMIATGVSRLAVNSSVFSNWVKQRYNIEYRLLSENDEVRCVYYAASQSTSGEEGLAIDIGGSSTEFVLLDKPRKQQGISLNIGLLSLYNECGNDLAKAKRMITRKLKAIPNTWKGRITGVGLTYTYLAAVVFKKPFTNPEVFNRVSISRKQLLNIQKAIVEQSCDEYLPYLINPHYLPIMKLNVLFNISLLDKFRASEIIVCSDGISVGYARWIKNKQKQRKT